MTATSPSETPTIDVRRADTRFRTRLMWLDSRHSFSFGPHYDPTNTRSERRATPVEAP